MISLYASIIIAEALVIIAYGFIYGVFPGTKYKFKVPQIQMACSVASLLLGLYGLIYCIYNKEDLLQNNSFFEPSILGLFLFFHVLFFGMSLFKYKANKTNTKEMVPETIKLKKEDYRLVNELEYGFAHIPGKYTLISYATFNNGAIAFTGAKPTTEIDATFFCYKLEEGKYQCLSYIDHSWNIKRVFRILSTMVIMIAALFMPYIFILGDIYIRQGVDILIAEALFEIEALILYGFGGMKLFGKPQGLMMKLIYGTCILAIISAVLKIIELF